MKNNQHVIDYLLWQYKIARKEYYKVLDTGEGVLVMIARANVMDINSRYKNETK